MEGSESSFLGLSPGQGHYVVLSSKTLHSCSASLSPGVGKGSSPFNAGVNSAMD